jgi:hypothetical protein
MYFFKQKFFKLLVMTLAMASHSYAAQSPLTFEHTIELEQYEGMTYLETVSDPQYGIKAHFDADYQSSYVFEDCQKLIDKIEHFDRKIVRHVLRSFRNDQNQICEQLSSLAGNTFSPDDIVRHLREVYSGRGNIYALSHFIGLVSGAGTLVVIDQRNYFYNFGYRDGSKADDVKSGRSYGASPGHNANDASDILYLKELSDYLAETDEPEQYFRVFLQIMADSNSNTYSMLSEKGQTAMTDFIAIYTAELVRHTMVDLNPKKHPWENDLAEATFMSVYSQASGLLLKGKELIESPLRGYWAKSQWSGRSGIGIGRSDRRRLQRVVSRYIRAEYKLIANDIDQIIGKRRDGDLFRGLMEFINNYDHQNHLKENQMILTEKYAEIIRILRSDADLISDFVRQYFNL